MILTLLSILLLFILLFASFGHRELKVGREYRVNVFNEFY